MMEFYGMWGVSHLETHLAPGAKVPWIYLKTNCEMHGANSNSALFGWSSSEEDWGKLEEIERDFNLLEI